MGELGDLLEVAHSAPRSFTTVRLEAREWRHNHRLQAAYDRAARRAGAGRIQIARLGSADELPAETEVAVRAWFEQPNRVREVRVDAGHHYVAVADGGRWWQRMPGWATTSDEGDGWGEGQIGHTIRLLLDPWHVLASLDLAVEGAAQVAGREGVLVGASERRDPHGGGSQLLAHGADRHELVFDAERGVLLRTASFLDGEPFSVVELLAVAFDERLDSDVFRFRPDPKEEVVRPEDVSPGDAVTVEAAARRASFTVLVPRSLGRGWRSHVLLRISVGPWHRVLMEECGTFVELDSRTVESEALVELALALEPAPAEPPPLVA